MEDVGALSVFTETFSYHKPKKKRSHGADLVESVISELILLNYNKVPSLTVKSKFALIDEIKQKLTNERLAIFSETCFGPWLELSGTDTSADPVLLLKVFEKQVTQYGSRDEMYFEIDGHRRRFGREDFCLITGLRFGQTPDLPLVTNGSCMRLFDTHTPKVSQLIGYFNRLKGQNQPERDNIDDYDAVRVCLLLVVERFFIGHATHVGISDIASRAINDLAVWNGCPWGSHVWDYTIRQMYDFTPRHSGTNRPTIYGFVYALKIWIMEIFPRAKEFYRKQNNLYPRALRWTYQEGIKVIKIKQIEKILDVSSAPPLTRLDADPVEFSSPWYAYFLGGDQQPQQQPQGYDYSQYVNRLVDIERVQAQQQTWQTQHDPLIRSLHDIQDWRRSVDGKLSDHDHWIQRHTPQAPQENLSFLDLLNSQPIPGGFPYDGVPFPMNDFDNTAGPSSSSYMPGTSVSHGMAGLSMLHDVAGTSAGTSYGPSMQHGTEMFHTPAQMPPPPEGRPHREVRPGRQLVTPFTGLQTATPEPERDDVDSGRRPNSHESEVLKLHRMGGLPATCRIMQLPNQGLKPNWWVTLLGEGPSIMYSSSHVDAWSRTVQAGHEKKRWTIMSSNFIKDLCKANVGENGVKMADGRMSRAGWPAWRDVDVVIMPHCVDKKHWVVFVLSFANELLTIYDPDPVDNYRNKINAMLSKFNLRVSQFLRHLGIISRGQDTLNFSKEYHPGGIRYSEDEDSGPLVCQIITLLAEGGTPSVATLTEDLRKWRHHMADILWAYVESE